MIPYEAPMDLLDDWGKDSNFDNVPRYSEIGTLCDTVRENIDKLEQKLGVNTENRDISIPSVEPMDIEKKSLKEKLAKQERKQSDLLQRYRTFLDNISDIRRDIWDLQQAMRYNTTLEQQYFAPMKEIDFEELRENIFTYKDVSQQQEGSLADIERIKEEIILPQDLTTEETVEHLKEIFVSALLDKKHLVVLLEDLEAQGESRLIALNKEKRVFQSSELTVGQIEKTGVLLKRSNTNSNKWKKKTVSLVYVPEKKFCELSFKSKDKVEGTMAMPWCVAKIASDPKITNEFCFQVIPRLVSKKKEYYTWLLCASSMQDMADWLFTLDLAAKVSPPVEELHLLGFKLLGTEG